MTQFRDDTLIEQSSPLSFEQTVARLTKAISDAGMRVFASIDHAENAREAGLSMPSATVLIYGKAAGGTPIMLQTPRSALDLPLHVLVREDTDGHVFVAFHPIKPVLEAAGVPADIAARLEPGQDLLLKVIQP